MADSEGPSHDANDPDLQLPPVARPVAPAPRVNPPNIKSAKGSPSAATPPGFNDFLEWMRSQNGGGSAEPEQTIQRGLIPKEKRKFQRREAEAKGEAPTAPADLPPEPAATPETDLEDWPSPEHAFAPAAGADPALPAGPPLAGPERMRPRVRRGQQSSGRRRPWLGLVIQFGVLVLLAGSFLLGRLSVSKVAPVTPSAAPAVPEVVNSEGKATTKLLSDENASLIDQAMAAEEALDFKKAEELLGKVKASGAHVPGLSFQLGQLALFEGDPNVAFPLLNEAIAQGENVAEAYNLRATLGSRSGRIRGNGLNDYETATRIDPFSAHIFYYWGTALRRAGKDQAAIVRLQQAIDRLREPGLESQYRLTLRLAKIEAGQEKDFADELARQLALPYPGMDWLITAAAEEMHNGNFAAAAGYLDRAAQMGTPVLFKLRLRDFYLSQFQYEKELTRFYPKPSAARPGGTPKPPEPGETPVPDAAGSFPATGLDVPTLPPPASPGVLPPH